ncbi:hypothetical protein ATCC90586_011607 [Pythium insidiosum]|nr:hypothetical protein ATCC90586_011607 [Pythium insidiosum]
MRYPIRPFCPLEKGFDIVGNDIASVQGPWGNCCDECAKTAGCRAWTWTDFNGGTCWLKSDRGNVKPNLDAISASIYEDLTPHPPQVDVDFEGSDIGNVPAGQPADCDGACRNTPTCRAYSWTDFNGGTCWLKFDVGQPVRKTGVTSGSPFPYGDRLCVRERGLDFVGNDIGSVPGAFQSDCCDICKKRDDCRAFTWTDFNGGTCWLKSGKGDAVENSAAVSAVVSFA